ncbi:MAG: CitMHS family transporter [Phenylobacterium sp.]|nr:CitMHS family transporter [Phenylobacterium sp.]
MRTTRAQALGDGMLSIAAFAMVATFMTLIMTRRLSAMIALILVPVAFGLLAGFGGDLGPMMLAGVKDLAPTGVMLVFAILYFGVMIDAGLFDPLIKAITALVRGDPVRILVGTAALAMIVSLDGDGSTTYMITTAAMIPLYRHMQMDVRKMACVIVMAGMVMNILPWGGPTARVMSALKLDASEAFVPLIPAMIATAAWVLFVAWRMGLQERRRLATLPEEAVDEDASGEEVIAQDAATDLRARRPRLLWFNLALTTAVMAALITAIAPLPVLFMVAFAIAMAVNYPRLDDQRERIATHAANALAVGGMVFAAGVFTGILTGTKMVDAMSATVTGVIPPALGPYMAPITAVLSAPFTYFISNDAFYFGVLPILAETASHYGLSTAEIGRASLVGQQVHLLSPLVPSTYLLVGLAGIEFGELTRIALKWSLGACAVFGAACLATGAFPLAAG